mmetsp:Transcript_26379/g.43163  ORF Transcript_26379/g.43163 Transcript_26379/m.43163 type:complete len:353 (+) Transcript_26379:212-1270(+)
MTVSRVRHTGSSSRKASSALPSTAADLGRRRCGERCGGLCMASAVPGSSAALKLELRGATAAAFGGRRRISTLLRARKQVARGSADMGLSGKTSSSVCLCHGKGTADTGLFRCPCFCVFPGTADTGLGRSDCCCTCNGTSYSSKSCSVNLLEGDTAADTGLCRSCFEPRTGNSSTIKSCSGFFQLSGTAETGRSRCCLGPYIGTPASSRFRSVCFCQDGGTSISPRASSTSSLPCLCQGDGAADTGLARSGCFCPGIKTAETGLDGLPPCSPCLMDESSPGISDCEWKSGWRATGVLKAGVPFRPVFQLSSWKKIESRPVPSGAIVRAITCSPCAIQLRSGVVSLSYGSLKQ